MDAKNASDAELSRGIRRVVTGFDESGKSVVVSDGTPPRITEPETLKGFRFTDMWHLNGPPRSPSDGTDLVGGFPPPGGVHWSVNVFPPNASVDQEEASRWITKINEMRPERLRSSIQTRAGMHQTNTIDFGIVLSGEIWLELDEDEVHLKAGDCVVQRGTKHAWNNRGTTPCVMSFVLLGVDSGKE